MRQPEWLGSAISIGLFAGLAAASWGLNEFLQRARLDAASLRNEGPNAIIEKPQITRSDDQGQPQYLLQAQRITFIERDDRSLLERPVIVSLTAAKPRTVLQADQAEVSDQQNRVELLGNVVIQKDPFKSQPAARIDTSRATVLIREELVTTDALVSVQRGLSTLQGIGMRLDQKTQRVDIISESRMIVPKEQKK
ncbi:MAG: LPS export ABC transporter periplasmic protein LptC [Betaproteobacteria bacterium]|nr:LPS export ABC transporter periplasmic protein LptC [Betaproteobacteria bacterium]